MQAIIGGRSLEDVLRQLVLRLSGMALRMAFKPIAQGLMSGLQSAISGAFSGGGPSVQGAMGAIKPFATGGVIGTPTYFPLSNGGVGLAGEAGPEAILPLSRGATAASASPRAAALRPTSPSTSQRRTPTASAARKPISPARSRARWRGDSGACDARCRGARPASDPDPLRSFTQFLLTTGRSRMAYIHPAWEEYQRQRYTRSDGDRYLKPPPFDHKAFIEEYRASKAAETARSAPVTMSFDDPEVRRLIAEIKLDLLRWQYWCKAYNPNQPRVPAGNPDGGQWTKIGEASGRTDERVISDALNNVVPGERYAARNERRGPGPFLRRIGNKTFRLSEDQALRFDTANREADQAIGRVQEIDPAWEPRHSLYEQDVEGQIRRSKELVLEAEAHLVELGHQRPARVIDIYRGQNNSVDLFGREAWPRDKDVVGCTVLDGIPVFEPIRPRRHTRPLTTRQQLAGAMLWSSSIRERYSERMSVACLTTQCITRRHPCCCAPPKEVAGSLARSCAKDLCRRHHVQSL